MKNFLIFLFLVLMLITGNTGRCAIQYNGKDQYSYYPNANGPNLNIGKSHFMVEAWVKFASLKTTTARKILSKTEGGGYALMLVKDNLRVEAKINGVYRTIDYPVSNLNTNDWFYLAGSYDGHELRLFVQGAEVGKPWSGTGYVSNTTVPLMIGAEPSVGGVIRGSYFHGSIGEVRIWKIPAGKVPLSYKDIIAEHNSDRKNLDVRLTNVDGVKYSRWLFEKDDIAMVIDKGNNKYHLININRISSKKCDFKTKEINLIYTVDSPTPVKERDPLTIATYNVLGFRGFPGVKAKKDLSTIDERLDFFEKTLRSLDADIITMQELSNKEMVKELAKRLNMNAGLVRGGGTLLSKYPVKEMVSFISPRGGNIIGTFLWRATLSIRPNQDIMIYGLHIWPTHVVDKADSIVSVLRQEKKTDVSQFLIGDFNLLYDNPLQLQAINKIWRYGLYDAFYIRGKGKGLTCTPGRLYCRVDYIFLERSWAENLNSVEVVSNKWTSPDYSQASVVGSDHLPVRISCKIPQLRSGEMQQLKPGQDYSFALDGETYLMKWMPSGEFMMGLIGGWSTYCQQPIHRVKLTQGFWMLEHEVTQKLWKSVMLDSPSYFKDNVSLPVEQVSWNNCQEFLKRLRKKIPSKLFRLPTEAEWSYACRAGGNKNIGGAWFDSSSEGKTHPVKKKKPNAWGLYDMRGNVYEWCKDDYVEKAYSRHSEKDPVTYYGKSNAHVVRGGSWFTDYYGISLTSRHGRYTDSENSDLGFRFVLIR